MNIFSGLASAFGFKDKKSTLQHTIPIKRSAVLVKNEKPFPIIDPRSISVVKSHTIIGAIDHRSFSRYSRLTKWLDTNEQAIAKRVLEDDEVLSSHELALYPNAKGSCVAFGPNCFGNTKYNDTVYVLGDTHGDFESFVAMLDTIVDAAKAQGDSNPIIYLLGDVIDRNDEGCKYVTSLIMAILQRQLPEEFNNWNAIRLGIVKGDHDVSLQYDEATKKFYSEVEPAEYRDWLNARMVTLGENGALIGKAWIRLMQECPAAAFLEGSCTLLAHGGIPRSDIQDAIKSGTPYIFQNESVAIDFEWCRMVDAKNKLLNRGTKTSEIGFQEFETFNQIVFNGRIKNFIFGHQHPASGYQRYDKFYPGYDVMCISSYRKDDSLGGPTIPYFCKITPDAINVYSMNPAKYVIRLEENSTRSSTPIASK